MGDWTAYPPLMRAKALEHEALTFEAAMVANRRPRDLMMLPTDWNASNLWGRVMVAPKFDGIHLGFSRRVDVGAYSREGTPFRAASHLLGAMTAVETELQRATGKLHRLFGEYVHPEGFDATVADFQRGAGAGVLMLFDAVSDGAWSGTERSLPLIERLALLSQATAAAGVSITDGGVQYARHELYTGAARDGIEVLAGAMWAQGEEGLVAKDADSPYVRGRSAHWMRLKRRESADLPIEAIETREDRTLKALVLRTVRNVLVRVGVGYSEPQRRDWNKLFGLGQVVEVEHLGETAKGSLRSPVFKRVRPDKAAR